LNMKPGKENTLYPKLGGTLDQACQRFAQGLGAHGAVIILYRGMNELAEIAMTFAPELKMDASVFERFTDGILNDTYSASITTPNRACLMLAEATHAECVMFVVIDREGAARLAVSHPQPKDFVAAFTLGISKEIRAMN